MLKTITMEIKMMKFKKLKLVSLFLFLLFPLLLSAQGSIQVQGSSGDDTYNITNVPDNVTIEDDGTGKLRVKNNSLNADSLFDAATLATFNSHLTGDSLFIKSRTTAGYTTEDSLFIGSTAKTTIYAKGTPVAEHPRLSAPVSIRKGINVLPDETNGYGMINIFQGYNPRGLYNINWIAETPSGKYKSQWAQGGDVARPLVTADSLSPVFVMLARYDTLAITNDVMSYVGWQFTDGSTYYRGQWGFNSVPGNTNVLFTFSSLNTVGVNTATPSKVALAAIHRAAVDSTNKWLTFTHSSTGKAKLIWDYTGGMQWYGTDGDYDGLGIGSKLSFTDGNTSSNAEWYSEDFIFRTENGIATLIQGTNKALPALQVTGTSTAKTGALNNTLDGIRLKSGVGWDSVDVSIYLASASSTAIAAANFVQDSIGGNAYIGRIEIMTSTSGESGVRGGWLNSGQQFFIPLSVAPTTSTLSAGKWAIGANSDGSKLVFTHNDGGTLRYYALDGTATSDTTFVYTSSFP